MGLKTISLKPFSQLWLGTMFYFSYHMITHKSTFLPDPSQVFCAKVKKQTNM